VTRGARADTSPSPLARGQQLLADLGKDLALHCLQALAPGCRAAVVASAARSADAASNRHCCWERRPLGATAAGAVRLAVPAGVAEGMHVTERRRSACIVSAGGNC